MTAPTLASTRIGGDDAPRTLVMLHGIYGRGRNWQSIARAVVAARPDYACWLPDLPHHGDSDRGAHGDTLRGLASDVDAWLDARQITPDVLLGHSFGGKVALALAAMRPTHRLQVWIVDSTPATRAPSGSAWTMLQSVRRLPARFPSRDEVVRGLIADGWPQGVATWMATNLARNGDAFTWTLDFDVMERLLHSFFTADEWPAVERPAPGHTIHFIKASESDAMSDEAVQRAESIADERVHVHHRPGGHWIHAESPQAIVDLLAEYLP